MKQIYLDYASTTPVEEGVVKKMTDFMSFDGNFGNPASRSHSFGWKADEAVEEARNNLATLIGCDPREIIWTSGATESDNLAIKGAARFYKNKGNHLVTCSIEISPDEFGSKYVTSKPSSSSCLKGSRTALCSIFEVTR